MIRYLLLAGGLAIAVPVLAQQQAPAEGTPPASAQSAATQPVAGSDQVAQVVGQEFPTYDTDRNGSLDRTEFSNWMITLKKMSDPTASTDSPASQSWAGAAFAQADADRSKSVSQAELTGFLSKRQS